MIGVKENNVLYDFFWPTDLNKLEQRPQKSLVKVVQDVARINENPNALTAVRVPSYADHLLVRGPLYSDIKVAVVSGGLDRKMSGVMGMYVLVQRNFESLMHGSNGAKHWQLEFGPIGTIVFCVPEQEALLQFPFLVHEGT